MKTETIKVYTCPRYDTLMKKFRDTFHLQAYLKSPSQKMSHKRQSERICRFCGNRYNPPITRFKKDAHVIPEFMGNKYLTNDFECDTCNETFGKYENSLKNYLGIIPTLTKTLAKKNRIPNFITKEVESRLTNKVPGDGKYIEIMQQGNTAIKYDFVKGFCEIKFTKNPYIPYHVYKALLKIALSTLPEEEVKYYGDAIKILNSDKCLKSPFPTVHVFTLSLTTTAEEPFLYLFKKKDVKTKTPSHVIILHFQNFIFQYYIPFHMYDSHVYNEESIDIPVCPPMFSEYVDDTILAYDYMEDFSSNQVFREDIQSLDLKFQPINNIENLVKYDPKTGLVENADNLPSGIKGLIFIPNGMTIKTND